MDSSDQTPATARPTSPRPTKLPIQPTTGPGALPSGPVPEAVLQRDDVVAAIEDEARRTGVDAKDVEVVGYADVTWRNGALGCPSPGMMYTQALVPGHQLILRVDGQLASYHAAARKPFAYCANPDQPVREDLATS